METHTRYIVDGAHLLLTQYEMTREQQYLEAAERALTFLINNLVDPLDDEALWIVHDSCELPTENVQNANPLTRSVSNSLCLNTHVWAMSALHRLQEISPGDTVKESLKGAWKGLRKVLDLREFNLIYYLPYKIRAKIVKWCASVSQSGVVLQA